MQSKRIPKTLPALHKHYNLACRICLPVTLAQKSCAFPKNIFKKLPVDQCPDKICNQQIDPCFSAGGGLLDIKGVVSLPVQVLGRKTMHPF